MLLLLHRSMNNWLNVIGPQVRQWRRTKGLTQDQVAAKCQVAGFDLTRGTLAKIESRVRGVSDHEIPFLARALDVPLENLFPSKPVALFRKPRNMPSKEVRAAE